MNGKEWPWASLHLRNQLCRSGIRNEIWAETCLLYIRSLDIDLNFWKIYPHARKWKKAESLKHFKESNIDDVMNEVKFLNWKIKFWLQDWWYMPACERWIRDFTITAETIKQQDIKNIVGKLMQMDKWEERSSYVKWLNDDFWKDVIDKFVREWNQNKNWITLNLK